MNKKCIGEEENVIFPACIFLRLKDPSLLGDFLGQQDKKPYL
jgi:hypothetical protein